jgi:hypothetical protein
VLSVSSVVALDHVWVAVAASEYAAFTFTVVPTAQKIHGSSTDPPW